MKKFLIAGLLVIGILLSPIVSNSFNATAGRTSQSYGGEYCDCGLPAPPVCYQEESWERCDIGSGGNLTAPPDGGAEKKAKGLPLDYPSGLLVLFVAAFLTSRAIRFP